MTLEKDEPKPKATRGQKIIWAVTLTVAGGCVIAAIVLAITFHVNIFASH
jgi:hypothetical protein